jgi:hypothetical protein
MPYIHRPIEEVEARIEIVRQNLRELTERAAGEAGVGSEEHDAEQIAEQEAELQSLEEERDAITKNSQA